MNTLFTKSPVVGTPLTPQVIRQINTAVRRYMPIAGPGVKVSHTAGGSLISLLPQQAAKGEKARPLPFEVRFDWTLDSESGGWKIYLPTEHLIQYDGEYLDPIGGVTAILDANGDATGWYSFDEITLQDDHAWLVISESSDAYTASFANAEDSQAVANICIAEVSYEAATESTPETITIKQSVVGAIVMSSGGGGGMVPDDISTEFIPDPPSGTQPDGDEGKLQVKGWKAGTPVSSYTVAQDIARDNADGNNVVVRNSSGTLEYKPIGTLAQLTGSSVTGTKTVLTGLRWDTTTHELVISSATVVYSKGIATSWTANADATIATTNIGSIVGS